LIKEISFLRGRFLHRWERGGGIGPVLIDYRIELVYGGKIAKSPRSIDSRIALARGWLLLSGGMRSAVRKRCRGWQSAAIEKGKRVSREYCRIFVKDDLPEGRKFLQARTTT